MNINTKNSENEIPQEILELLPWYVSGQLSTEDQAVFQNALIKYPELKEELEQEQRIVKHVSLDKSLLELSAIAHTDERVKSVLNLIDAIEPSVESNIVSKTDESRSILDSLKNALIGVLATTLRSTKLTRVASLGALVLSVGVLTAFVAPIFTDQSEFIPASVGSKTLVNEQSVFSKTQLLVGFKGTIDELKNNLVLDGKQFNIVKVPEKEGMFQIKFVQKMSEEELEVLTHSLLKNGNGVWFAGEAF